MKLKYFKSKNPTPLIEEYYQLTFSEEAIPFKSTIIPTACSNITFIYGDNQRALVNNKEYRLKNLIATGQFFRSYQFFVDSVGESFGMSLHPTTMHKILNIDVSILENKHLPLKDISPECFSNINSLFEQYKNDNNPELLIERVESLLGSANLTLNKNTEYVDTAIDIIRENEGMIYVDDLLTNLPISQKTLETQFKKIVGLTPGKYIRLYRFLNLMRKYENEEINIKDLLYMYDYYDRSHFSKDFKLFMQETPKSYFKKDYPLLSEILKNS